MNNLINVFVRRPVTVVMIISALIIAAVFSLFNLPINSLPEISLPRVTVETVYPGMAASEVRQLVTIPLEDGLSSIKGLEKIRSVSRDNRSLISMDFRWGVDPQTAAVLVREAIDAVYSVLPEGARKPTVTAGDSNNEPHAVIAISPVDNGEMILSSKLAEYEIRARLRRIDGVGSVILVGNEIAEQKLSLDVLRLAALGISPSDFAGLLSQEIADIPAGNAKENNKELVVISSGKPETVYDLSKIILPVANGILTVEDAGLLISSIAKKESIFVYNGKEAVALEIYRRPGADPLRLSRDIRKTLNEASSLFERDVLIEIINDSTPSLLSGIINFLISASLAIFAVVLVLLIFIHNLKYSLLASLSIPFSAAAGICVLFISGKTLNSMSLGGLAMGIGLVSDISVIVLDLLNRNFINLNKVKQILPDPKEIGDKTASIAGSSIASTLTTALVFLPILFLPGMIGSIFGDIAIALVSSVIAGWFYAQFCLPSLFRLFFNKHDVHKKINSNLINRIKEYYSQLLFLILNKPKKYFSFVVLITIIGIISLTLRPIVFINPDSAEEIIVSVSFPSGTQMKTISETGFDLTNKINEFPFIKTVYGRAGAEEEDINSRADIEYEKEKLFLRCVLKKNIKPENALSDIKKFLEQNYGFLSHQAFFPKDKIEVLLGLSNNQTHIISAKNKDELEEKTEFFKKVLSNTEINAELRPLGLRPELRLIPNREASAFLSIPASHIAESLFVLNEGVVAAKLDIDGYPLDVRIMSDFSGYDPVTYMEQIPILTPKGNTVYLGSLGQIERKSAEAVLARLDRSDVLYVDIQTDKKLPLELNSIISKADESVLNRYKNSLILYVVFVLILLYMTMGAQFESFLLPLILMLSIPFSLAGAGPALLISGSKIDSGAILGLTALFGLVVNNSLILFEISEEKIRSGCIPVTAVYNGATDRLQAILITTSTTVFALLPLIISPMANSQKSMAAAMIGGLIASTLLSLFIIPPVLVYYLNWKNKTGDKNVK